MTANSEHLVMGHPRGLVVLFFAEMWERFSYYGMRGLLILYLTKHWLFSDASAGGIYASYAAMVYLMPVLGGLVADRYLGFRRAVITGAILLCCGHLGMAFEGKAAVVVGDEVVRDNTALGILFASLAFIIVGVGLLKPSISSIVGELYGPDDPRRDGGFTLFYMGINVGAVLAALTCGYLGEAYGWGYGFGLAGVGMLAGLVTFVMGRGWLEGKGEVPDLARLHAPTRAGVSVQTLVYLGIGVCLVLSWWLMQHQAVVGQLLSGTALLAVVGVIGFAVFRCSPVERNRLLLVLFLTAYSVIFWALFEQAGSSMNLFADRNVDRTLWGLQISAAQLQFLNPAFIILLAPLFAGLWAVLGQRGREPSVVTKFGLAVLLAGLGFLVLVYGIEHADDPAQVALVWLMLAYLIHTMGELCLSPVGLSMVTRLSVPRVVGLMMGVWFLSSSVAHYVAGLIAAAAGVSGGAEADAADSALIYAQTFGVVGQVGVLAGIALLLGGWASRWLFSRLANPLAPGQATAPGPPGP